LTKLYFGSKSKTSHKLLNANTKGKILEILLSWTISRFIFKCELWYCSYVYMDSFKRNSFYLGQMISQHLYFMLIRNDNIIWYLLLSLVEFKIIIYTYYYNLPQLLNLVLAVIYSILIKSIRLHVFWKLSCKSLGRAIFNSFKTSNSKTENSYILQHTYSWLKTLC
jgi:hypothetical protein